MPARQEIRIRPFNLADTEPVMAILNDTFTTTWLPQLTAAAARAFRDEDRPRAYVTARGQYFWIAEDEADVIGFIDWDDDFINALHVASSHSRRGAGTRLLAFAEAAIREAGHNAAQLETDTFNTRSRAFYAARGYREVDFYPDREWGSGLTTVLLVKSLG